MRLGEVLGRTARRTGLTVRADDRSARSESNDGPAGPSSANDGWADREPAVEIARAVAAAEGVEVTALPPLFDAVDPDGLTAVLRSAPDARVSFTHLGYDVTVTGRGQVEVSHLAEE